jgi:hypothetical protein
LSRSQPERFRALAVALDTKFGEQQ